jgi:hypothetical protein
MTKRIVVAFLIGLAVGCGRADSVAVPAAAPTPNDPVPSAGGAKYLLTAEPAGAKGVLDVRKDSKDADVVVIVGRIGGSQKPFTGRGAFTIVDSSLKPCNERGDDACPYPWDYCCDPPEERKKATVLVKFMTEQGDTLPDDARQLLGVKELQTVVVKGKAKRDDAGNLTILADALYVRR